MFPAMRGDCTLIKTDSINLIVDFGYKATYSVFLRDYLLRMAELGNKIDVCVISHIDADHIEGAAEGLFLDNKDNANPQIITIDEVWYNGYRHLPSTNVDNDTSLTNSDRSILEEIASAGLNTSEESIESQVSAEQGMSLASLLRRYNYAWNSRFEQGAVYAPKTVQLSSNMLCHIISPIEDNLRNLAIAWKRELQKRGFESKLTDPQLFEEAYQSWAGMQKDEDEIHQDVSRSDDETIISLMQTPFKPDRTIINSSSIAFILEYNEKKIMLLADSNPEVIISELHRLFPECNMSNPVWFDCVKIAHHGAFRNNSPDLLRLIESDCYLFSTDGLIHNHPDAATIAWVVGRPRHGNIIRKLYFNYRTESATKFDREDWKSRYGYEVHINNTEGVFKVDI